MAYGKFKSKKTNWKSKSKGKSIMDKSKGNRDMRFKQINTYKVKPEPFPRVLYTKAKFGQISFLTTPNSTNAAAVTYRLNSIFDPVQNPHGQPFPSKTVVGYQEMASLYNRYLVTGCKVSVRFYDPNAESIRVGVRLRIDGEGAVNGVSQDSLVEQPLTYISGLSNSGKQIKSFNLYVKPYTLLGLSKLEYFANTTNYSSNIGSNPLVDRCYMDIFAVSGSAVSHAVSVAVKLTYYVQLYDRQYLSSSVIPPA